jgi:CRISPR-associated protein Cas2
MKFSGQKNLWLQVMFDLPVKTKKGQKEAGQFRNHLLNLGFEMAQFSVYQRYIGSKERVEIFLKQIEGNLPTAGKVHILSFTDKQYENIVTFRGQSPREKQKNPDQFVLF